MIFWDAVIAAIMGAAAFLQADAKRWRLFAAAAGLIVLGVGAILAFYGLGVDAETMAAGKLKLTAFSMLPLLGIVLFLGTTAGAIFGRWLTAGKTGMAVFIGSYLAINFIFYAFVFGAAS